MEWFWFILIGLAVVGWISKSSEQDKKKKEIEADVALKRARAEEARAAILASGNKEAIERLHLMEASYQASQNQVAPQRAGSGMLGTATAVAGGMVIGNAISGAVQAAQLEAAFADIEANLDASAESTLADLDGSITEGLEDDSSDFEL